MHNITHDRQCQSTIMKGNAGCCLVNLLTGKFVLNGSPLKLVERSFLIQCRIVALYK